MGESYHGHASLPKGTTKETCRRDFPQALHVEKMMEEDDYVEKDSVEEEQDDDGEDGDVENGDVDKQHRSQDI